MFYKYTPCRNTLNTKRCNEIINKEKIKHKIIEKETALSIFNPKTSKINDCRKLIINKN